MNPEAPQSEVQLDAVLPCRDEMDEPLCQFSVEQDIVTGGFYVHIHTLSAYTTNHGFPINTRNRHIIESAIRTYAKENNLSFS